MKNQFATPAMTPKEKSSVASRLASVLADSYTLYLKTHNYHWNVTGPMFTTLHTLFETQYTELALAVDEIAERIRALGVQAPGSYREFSELTNIQEAKGSPSAGEMLRQLVEDQNKLVAVSRDALAAGEAARDAATVDLLTRRIQIHEKNAWMLRSHLEQ